MQNQLAFPDTIYLFEDDKFLPRVFLFPQVNAKSTGTPDIYFEDEGEGYILPRGIFVCVFDWFSSRLRHYVCVEYLIPDSLIVCAVLSVIAVCCDQPKHALLSHVCAYLWFLILDL